ncbi:MAG TPA: hypothetical protein VM940_04680 [Chthoniobacterales bacterium]|jgi:ankyrin repeat protein|nr:hypothetical protein [Chthoniobacterales bacterium]
MPLAKKLAIVAALCAVVVIGFFIWFFTAFYMSMERGEENRRKLQAEQRSGRAYFNEQPALLAVAQGVANNNPDAIRAAAQAVPDLNAPGHEGMTLLCFAIRESWQRPELFDAVNALLAIGADPNHTNGQQDSFAMAAAVHASEPVLRAMLDARGNPNATDPFGRPIILMNWYLGYFPGQARARMDLLLERGADINAAMPARDEEEAGDTLLIRRTKMGLKDPRAYADALSLLERGADPNRASANGTTFGKVLAAHRAQFSGPLKSAPPEFTALWTWAEGHSIQL